MEVSATESFSTLPRHQYQIPIGFPIQNQVKNRQECFRVHHLSNPGFLKGIAVTNSLPLATEEKNHFAIKFPNVQEFR